MTKEQVIEQAKADIEEKGYVHVKYLIFTKLKMNPQPSFVTSVIALLVNSGKYLKESGPKDDIRIIKNPNYKKQGWTEKNKIAYDLFKLVAAAIIGALVTYLSVKKDCP